MVSRTKKIKFLSSFILSSFLFSFLISFYSSALLAKEIAVHVPKANIEVVISDSGELMKDHALYELPQSFFSIAYSLDERIPRLTAFVLGYDGETEKGRRKRKFDTDPQLKPLLGDNIVRSSDFEDPENNFSRGHLVPSGAYFKAAKSHSTFIVTNIAPQYTSCNSGPWGQIENEILSLVMQFKNRKNKYLVLTGTLDRNKEHKKLKHDKSEILIPSHYFSIIVELKMNEGKNSKLNSDSSEELNDNDEDQAYKEIVVKKTKKLKNGKTRIIYKKKRIKIEDRERVTKSAFNYGENGEGESYSINMDENYSNVRVYVLENKAYSKEEMKTFRPHQALLSPDSTKKFFKKLGLRIRLSSELDENSTQVLNPVNVGVQLENSSSLSSSSSESVQ